MQSQLFRKKTVERISSPEQLQDYMRVTNPGIWMVLAAVIVLLAGLLTASALVRVETTVAARGEVAKAGSAVAMELPLSQRDAVREGMAVRLAGEKGRVDYVYERDGALMVNASLDGGASLPEGVYDVEIVTETYNGALTKLGAGSFHLALCSFAMDVCPDPGFLLMSGNTGNYGRYRSTAMTDLCKELRACVNQQDYRAKLMDIQRRFAEDCPFICMFYRSGAVLTRMMYTTARDVREGELLRGIETFRP